ncbi:hypothetical protein ACH5RR_031423 [Cinchona calisaya]|uniref:DNA-directed RNA polymerase subunit n=1 Tax=Cinchona calisaya TaxID=153742 RepID=A0ABD2YGK1_9GENT
MFLKSQLSWNISIPPEELHLDALKLRKSIYVRLLAEFAEKKATEELGYFIAVTTVDKVGEGIVRHSGEVVFPVDFSCITFKVFTGEVLRGVVHKIYKHGIFLRCGPLENVFISNETMPGYCYVPGENPIFMRDTSKIEKDAEVRFVVIEQTFQEDTKEFRAVGGLEGDFLGPM